MSERVARLPNTSLIAARGVKAETLVIGLDLAGFAVSAGSACSSGKVEPSHVLAAMGVSPELAEGAIRVSLGFGTRDRAVGSQSNIGDAGMAVEEGRACIYELRHRDREEPHLRVGPPQPGGHGVGADDRRALDRGQRARRARRRDAARLPDLGQGRRASTAGRTRTGARSSTTACRRTRRRSRARPSPTSRSAATPPRSASAGCRRARCPVSPRAWRSASTARGTAACSRATSSPSCRSRTASRPANSATSSPASCRPTSASAYGRPVGVALAADGSVLMADDVGNVIWRVTAA